MRSDRREGSDDRDGAADPGLPGQGETPGQRESPPGARVAAEGDPSLRRPLPQRRGRPLLVDAQHPNNPVHPVDHPCPETRSGIPERRHFPYLNDETGAVVGASLETSQALLMGRMAYDDLAVHTPDRRSA
jgi:hypothetical protein